LHTLFQRYDRHLAVIGITGLALLLGGFDVVVVALRGMRFDEIHSPLGQWAAQLAGQFTPAPSPTRVGSQRIAATTLLYLLSSALCTLLFALLAWRRMAGGARRSVVFENVLLAAQMLLGLCGDSALLMVLAAELALVLPLKRGLLWLALQATSYMVLELGIAQSVATFSDGHMRLRLLYLGMEVVVQCIVFAVLHLAALERRRRRALAAAHAELLATQSLLTDLVRDSERLRIARDLHDSVGHHLTALKLHLDLALRQAGAGAPASLATASGLAAALLAEVRTVVSSERRAERIDLRRALATLCDGIPSPRITLTMADDVMIDSPALAHALFCCAQEAVSNSVRHAGAATLTIDIAQRGGHLTMLLRDDGRGKGIAVDGNGLRGMRERLALLGGCLQTGDRQPRGFELAIDVPLSGGPQ
jgi:two-component system sensor histidine kinase DesK